MSRKIIAKFTLVELLIVQVIFAGFILLMGGLISDSQLRTSQVMQSLDRQEELATFFDIVRRDLNAMVPNHSQPGQSWQTDDLSLIDGTAKIVCLSHSEIGAIHMDMNKTLEIVYVHNSTTNEIRRDITRQYDGGSWDYNLAADTSSWGSTRGISDSIVLSKVESLQFTAYKKDGTPFTKSTSDAPLPSYIDVKVILNDSTRWGGEISPVFFQRIHINAADL